MKAMESKISVIFVPCAECGKAAARIPFEEFLRLRSEHGEFRMRCRKCAGEDEWLPNVMLLPPDDGQAN